MSDLMRKITPTMYGIIIICFFMPFANVSCSGQKFTSLTGIQMVVGTDIEQPSMFGAKPQVQKVQPEPLAVAAFAAAIVGIFLSLSKNKAGIILSTIASVSGIIAMLMLKSKLDSEVDRAGMGMIQLNYEFGYWSTFVLFCLTGILSGYSITEKTNTAALNQATETNVNKKVVPTSANTCDNCGTSLLDTERQCQKCGTPAI